VSCEIVDVRVGPGSRTRCASGTRPDLWWFPFAGVCRCSWFRTCRLSTAKIQILELSVADLPQTCFQSFRPNCIVEERQAGELRTLLYHPQERVNVRDSDVLPLAAFVRGVSPSDVFATFQKLQAQ